MFHPSRPGHQAARLVRPLLAGFAGLLLALTAAPALPALAQGPSGASVDAALAAQLGAAKQKGEDKKISVIVVARTDVPRLEAELHHDGFKHTVRVELAHGIAVSMPAAWIEHLRSDPNVERIIFDAPARLTDSTFSAAALATVYPYVVDAVPLWSNPISPLTGAGVGVAVVDSGVTSHPDLAQVTVNVNFNPNVATPNDDFGHGTAVAGVIAGNGAASNGHYIGIAPQASIINLRVNDGSGAAPTSGILNAILWAVQNRQTYNIRVLNLSFISSVAESYTTSPIDAAAEFAWLKGIVVVAAAGNNGPNSALYAPANDPYIITVGATDAAGTVTTGDDSLASFSSYGLTQDGFSKPDLVAPGRQIITTLAPGSSFATNYSAYTVGSQYIMAGGTSMAAPEVSGVAALYIEHNPTIRPAQLKALLEATAAPLPWIVGSGAGYPDAQKALTYTGLVGTADMGLHPNNYLQVMYMMANNLTSAATVSWDSVSWDSVSWNDVSWDSVSWDCVSWSN